MKLSGHRPFFSPAARTMLLWIAAVAAIVLAVLALPGCHAAPAAHVAVPTAATVQEKIGAPAAAARTSNARAVQLAAKAEKVGLIAGSADARTLSLATAETDRHLADVLAGKDTLTAQLGAVQIQIDALEKHDAAQTALATARGEALVKVEHSRWRWVFAFGLSLVADFFAGHLIEQYLRGAVAVVHRVLATGYHFAAGALKTAFPLYFFWLPD